MELLKGFDLKNLKKEVKIMKKLTVIMTVMVMAAFFATCAFAAVTVDKTASVSASASIGGTTSLSALPNSISFTTTNADAFADNKITLTYVSNYNPWKIAIYTNNTQVPNYGQTNGRYAKGGLATTTGLNVVACKWVAKDPASTAPAIGTIGSYNFIKDKRDEDDPDTAASGTMSNNESWSGSFAEGYANIAYGNSTSGVCVDPTKTNYNGDPVNGSIAVYVAGLFGTGGVTPAVPAAAGEYSASVGFDLYHE
jgi:hypothetical protein